MLNLELGVSYDVVLFSFKWGPVVGSARLLQKPFVLRQLGSASLERCACSSGMYKVSLQDGGLFSIPVEVEKGIFGLLIVHRDKITHVCLVVAVVILGLELGGTILIRCWAWWRGLNFMSG